MLAGYHAGEDPMSKTILVTGALGQIGSELVPALRERYGRENVIASDIRMPQLGVAVGDGPFEHLDCTKSQQIQDILSRHNVGALFHLAALLSAVAEDKPQMAWHLNMDGVYQVLEAARQSCCAVFFPSSIGAFGPTTPRENTPQDTVQRPTTMYGVTKVAAEMLCDYYFLRFGVDTRGLRLPGLISHVTPAGGGTTDYAVEIFYQAIRYHHYTCFLRPDTRLEMMYMPDAINAIINLMEASPERLRHRNAFNITAMNFTPEELASEIRKHIPTFVIDYEVDPIRQAIADSWPLTIDDSAAHEEWNWQPSYTLESMTKNMIDVLRRKVKSAK
ncbi:MAG: nucleoside-diphosphate-sugar epimerase [Alphaproteobacteria bacterium]|jgi:nucleoside-diphosphate-sugar epimerase